MTVASKFYPFDRTNVLYNLQDWEAMLGELVKSNPEAADKLAQVMYETISTLQEPGRLQETIDTYKLGLEWIYPYTSAHAMSFTLFLFDEEGALKDLGGLETFLMTAIDKAYGDLKHRAIDGSEESPDRDRETQKPKTRQKKGSPGKGSRSKGRHQARE